MAAAVVTRTAAPKTVNEWQGYAPASDWAESGTAEAQPQVWAATRQPKRAAEMQSAAQPGWFNAGGQPQVVSALVQQQPPRRFPGHFAPHRLCNHFTAHGWCRRAEACTFAHGLQELHPDVQAQLAPQLGIPVVAATGKNGGKSKGRGKSGATAEAAAEVRQILGAMQTAAMPVAPTQYLPASTAYYSVAAGAPTSTLNSDAAPFAFPFNAGAAEFVPITTPGAPATTETSPVTDGDAAAETSPEEGATTSGTSTPSRAQRRPHPAPLTLDTDSQPNFVQYQSPTAAVTVVRQQQPLASPVHVQVRTVVRSVVPQPLSSPKAATMSPTGHMCYTSSPVAAAYPAPRPLASPMRAPIPQPLASPVQASGTPIYYRSPGGSAWPASPTMVLSPGSMMPSTPVPINRNQLLQARQVAMMLEQGPPGLQSFAPTPTTKAGNLGFRYPQPGYLVARPTAAPAVTHYRARPIRRGGP